MRQVFFLFSLIMGMSCVDVTLACDEEGHSGIVADNDLWISTDDKNVNTELTKEVFNKIIDDVSALYAPVIAERGAKLVVNRDWDNGTVNAYAQQQGKTWIVRMFGGLARHKTVTPDGFALVLCHELGHHIGGAPKKSNWFGRVAWATNEGQADYWGNLKCMRNYLKDRDNVSYMSEREVPEFVLKKCQSTFTAEGDQAICKRTALAGLSLGELFRSLRRQTDPISFHTPDPKVVSKTYHGHPLPQCRLDTYFQGALCDRDLNDRVDDADANLGVCTRTRNETEGIRPLCWYKPKQN